MQIQLLKLATLLFAISLCETGVLADESSKKETQSKKEAAASEALRQKVAKNIGAIVDGLKVSRVQKAKVESLTTETQWKAAVSAFKTTRGEEIHTHAHKLFPKTIPDRSPHTNS